jgi:hypothetical protein
MMIEKQHKIGMFDNLQTPEKLWSEELNPHELDIEHNE